jgi:FKBP-type peptidyl-prolyl cis-trans isomerase
MNKDEALSKLELEEGATSSEINTQYQEFHNEFQMRITNAPTEHQRKLYQKKLEELSEAFNVLGGENPESNTQELPGISESEVVETEKRAKSSASNQAEMSQEKALQILGLGEKFTEKELAKAFQTKVSGFENGRDNAATTSIKNGYEEAIIECNSAYKLLKGHVYIPTPKSKFSTTEPFVKNNMDALKKKWLLPVSIVGGVIILIILFFVFGNGSSSRNEPINPANHDEYVSLKSQADLLAKQGNWQEALAKYKAAYNIVITTEVKDSISSMKNHLLLAAVDSKVYKPKIETSTIEITDVDAFSKKSNQKNNSFEKKRNVTVNKTYTTKSGLQYMFTEIGEGRRVKAGDKVTVHFIGKLTDGKEFGSSYKRGTPYSFTVGEGKLIKGWDEGIALINVGDKVVFTIPSELAYGPETAAGIPANSTLIFEVELLNIIQ